MRICLSKEATAELDRLRSDPDLFEGAEACIGMLKVDINEFEGNDGFSIARVQGLFASIA